MDFAKLFSLEGKIALITGGSRGIGKMLLEGYLAAGCERVYITARKKAQLDETVAEFEAQYPGKVIGLAGDLSQQDGIAQLVEALTARETRLDVLVNNAGAAWGGDFETFTEVGWDLEWHFDEHLKLKNNSDEMLLLVDSMFAQGKTKTPGNLVLLAHDQVYDDADDSTELHQFIKKLKAKDEYNFETVSKYPGLKRE